MEFLKSAVASAITKGSFFPYSFGDRVDNGESIWTLHNATRREDGSSCSVFAFDLQKDRSRLPLAKNALRKLRTLRHPGIVKVLDTIENETHIYIITETLQPLTWLIKRKSISEETAKWGLHSVALTLKFINDDAASVHGNIRSSSIYTSSSGEWKLAGFEILSSMKDDDAVIYTLGNRLPDFARYAPPEVANGDWAVIKKNPIAAVDSYGLAILIFEVFNGNFRGRDQLSQSKIAPSMAQSFRRLININPKARLSAAHFVEQGQRPGSFFETPLIRLTTDIDNLGLKSEGERDEFLSELDLVADDIPEEFFKMKVCPELLKSLEFGSGGPKVLTAVLKMGTKFSDDEYESILVPAIIRLFASPDRAIRVCLLDSLPLMIDRLSQKDVTNKIFPSMVTGFTDGAPIVREQSVKAVLVIIDKLSDRAINGELLRYLAKTANDEQPGIRTNTTICLGKIARNLGQSSRSKVLVAAFTRSLRDPFVHARNAALLALSATQDFFCEDDCANKVLPSICSSLIDKEKIVRDQANKTFDLYLLRVRKHAESLTNTALPATDVASTINPSSTQPVQTSGSSWAGWAISSFTNKTTTARGDMQPSTTGPMRLAPSSRAISPSSSEMGTPSIGVFPPPVSPGQASQDSDPLHAPQSTDQISDDAFQAWDTIEEEDDSFFDAPSRKRTPSPLPNTSHHSNEEPDFAGWLAAQSQAKSKRTMPKGLTKSSNLRPGLADRTTSTNSVVSKASAQKISSNPKSKVTSPVKKIDTAPKEAESTEDAWGDDWN